MANPAYDAICSQERFLGDVKNHTMKVVREDGVYRHLSFTNNGSSVYRFDLHTWPGYLCYTGDMGTYVFERLHDMFEFFRTDRMRRPGADPEKLSINLQYWTEKLVAVDGNRGGGKVKDFSEPKFRRVVNEYRTRWMHDAKDRGFTAEERKELWEAVNDEVLCHLESNGDRAMHAAYEFHHILGFKEQNERAFCFDDFFEHDFTEFSHSIIWCCYALAWGIQTYDVAKAAAVEVVLPAVPQ